MHGTGSFKWYDGKIYEGEFSNGQLHGNGVMYYPNGQMAKGAWHHGENMHLDVITAGKSQIRWVDCQQYLTPVLFIELFINKFEKNKMHNNIE